MKRERRSSDSSETSGASEPCSSALLGLPDVLLCRVIKSVCATEDDYDSSCESMEAKHRAFVAPPAAASSPSTAEQQPCVDLRRLSDLRRVCRRLKDVVDACVASPRVRMAMNATDVKEESEAALERLCARAARMCGPDIKEIVLKIYPVERCNRPAFSLAPLAQFADLGALRVYGENRWFHSVRMLDSEHVLSLASLSKLSRLDLKGLSISPAAVAALHELPLAAFAASFYCSDFADDTDDEDEEAAYRGDRYVPAAEAAVSAVVTAFPGLQRLLLYMALCAEVVEACNVNVPPSVLRPLASLASLRSLSLSFDDDAGLQSVAPIAALSRLEHLALEAGFIENMQQLSSMTALRSLHLQDTHRRGTLASEELSSLARLPQLEALRVQLSEQGGVDLSSLFGLAPRLRLLSFEIDKEDLWLEDLNSVGRRIAKTLLRFTALEHVWLDLPEPCALALSRHSLAPWSGVRTLGLGGHDPSADLVRRIAFDMTSLRELVLGGSLPLPLPADVAAAFRGRLRRVRMRANVEQVQSTGDAATTDELRARLAVRPRQCGYRYTAQR